MSGITYSVNDADKVLQKYGISLVDSQGKMRDLSDVLNDLGAQWDKMSRLEQNQISYVVAGTRQRNVFTAAMADYNRVLDATEVSATAVGTAEQKMEVYTQSLEAAQNRLTAAIQTFAQDTNIDQILITLTNGLTKIIELLDLVLNRIPIVSQALKGLIAVATINAVSTGIGTLIARLGGLTTITNLATGAIPKLMTGLAGLSASIFGANSAVATLFMSLGTLSASFPLVIAGFAAVSAIIFGIGKAIDYAKSKSPEAMLEAATNKAKESSESLKEVQSQLADIKATLDRINDGSLTLTDPEDKKRLESQLETLQKIEAIRRAQAERDAQEQRDIAEGIFTERFGGEAIDYEARTQELRESRISGTGMGAYLPQSDSTDPRNVAGLAEEYRYLSTLQNEALENGRELNAEQKAAFEASRKGLEDLLIADEKEKLAAQERGTTTTDAYKNLTAEIEFLENELGIVKIQANETSEALSFHDAGKQLSQYLADFLSKTSETGQAVNALKNAYEDMRDSGKLGVDTVQELLSVYPELIKDLEIEGDVTSISIDKLVELFEAKKQERIVSIQAQIDETQSAIDGTSQRIALYQQEIQAVGSLAAAKNLLAAGYELAWDIDTDELTVTNNALTQSLSNYRKELNYWTNLSLPNLAKASKSTASSMKKDISSVKSATEKLLNLTLAMLKKEYEQQKKNLQDQKDSLDKQQEAFENKIKAQQKFLDLQEQEIKHAKELEEKNKAIANIQEELLELQYDTSAEGQRKQLELLDNLSDANKDLADYQSDYALDQQKQSLSDQLDNYKEYIDNLKDGIDEQIKYIDDVRLNETNLYMEAIGLIEGRSGEFYNRLVEYNKTYGDHTVETVNQAWMVAYTALDTYGGSYKEFLDTINSQMLIINDNTKTTTDTANKLADAYERAAKAYQVFTTSGAMSAYEYYKAQTGGPLIKFHDGTEFVKKNNTWLDKMLGLGNDETAAILKVGEAVIPDYANNIAKVKHSAGTPLLKNRSVNYSASNTNVGSTFNIEIPINIAGNATDDVVRSLKAVSNDIANSVFKRMNEITAMGGYKNIARATT